MPKGRDELSADSCCVSRICPSPSHGERAGGRIPEYIILHYTGMSDGASALAWLCDPGSSVSCHYLVEEDGAVVQLVAEGRRAWHAGRSQWKGENDLNSASIGIEIVNGGHDAGLPAYRPKQIKAVIALCRDLVHRHPIRPECILAHSDVAPGRKQDPGERFPWADLFAAGLGHWVPEQIGEGEELRTGDYGPGVSALQADLAKYGYAIEPTGRFDEATRVVVAAFQRHFRPSRVDGVADPPTVATLQRLIQTLPAAPGEAVKESRERLQVRA